MLFIVQETERDIWLQIVKSFYAEDVILTQNVYATCYNKWKLLICTLFTLYTEFRRQVVLFMDCGCCIQLSTPETAFRCYKLHLMLVNVCLFDVKYDTFLPIVRIKRLRETVTYI
jgi:hypothetical protein